LVRALGDRPNVEVVVVTSSMGGYEVARNSFTPNSTIYYLPIGKDKGNIHFQTDAELIRYSWACHRFLKKLLERESFDHCHAHMTVPAGVNAWCYRNRVPYLVFLQGSDVPGYSARFKRLYTFLTPIIHRVWKDATHVVSNSTGLRKLALESAPQQPVEVIPNGIDAALFSPHGAAPPENGKLHVICVGRLIERKGVWELVKGFRKVASEMPNTHLDLVGTGVLDEPLREWIREHDLEDGVTLHGPVDHDVVPEHLRRASLFVLPSHAEGMSNALLEGMACGLPVVVTETGGTRELVDGNGLVVPKESPDALAEAILSILADDKRRGEMRAASLRVAARFSWQSMARDFMQLYE
jgi:glycosyltransferase involved in cell wall biosynthesis